jgi:hypothetical protein
MFERVQSFYVNWRSKPHPRLLLIITLLAALVAGILLISAGNDSVVLYKEF